MTLTKIELYKYSLPLTKELHLKETTLSNREGLLIKLTSSGGQTGWGEIAPLPSFSKESSGDAAAQLKQFLLTIANHDIPPDILNQIAPLYPSVRFGLESALLSMQASLKSLPLRKLLNPTCSDKIEINALLTGSPEEILQQLEIKLANGYKTFKLKIGRSHFKDEMLLIEQVAQSLPPDGSLRLDANRAYNYKQGLNLFEKLSGLNIEYIEEPFENPNDIKRYLTENSSPSIGLALDETLVNLKPEQLMELKNVAAVILKPTLLGFTKCMTLARVAMELKMKPVISSSFESSLGLFHLASMAAVIDHTIPVGLDTLNWFESDSTEAPLEINNGSIDLSHHDEFYQNLVLNKKGVTPLG